MFSSARKIFVGAATLGAGQGGIASVARNSARALIEDGADLSIISLADKEPINIAGHFSGLARESKANFFARCHVAATTHDAFLYDFLGTARAHMRLPGLMRPYALWIHGIEIWGQISTQRSKVLRNAHLILSNSAYTLDRFQERHGEFQQAKVCRLGTEFDGPADNPATFDGPPTALIVARMGEGDFYKGHRELIEVWPRVVAAVPQARLVIVGGGSAKQKVVSLAEQSTASASIDVKGFLSEVDLAETWRQAHVFAMPSRGEGFGLVYIEAMRYGLPVIASVHDAGQEVNVDGVTGRNINLDTPKALEESLIEFLSDASHAQQFGRAGQERWRNEFRYSAFKRRFLEAVG